MGMLLGAAGCSSPVKSFLAPGADAAERDGLARPAAGTGVKVSHVRLSFVLQGPHTFRTDYLVLEPRSPGHWTASTSDAEVAHFDATALREHATLHVTAKGPGFTTITLTGSGGESAYIYVSVHA